MLVIGGGITGALVSYALVQKNYRVMLIDKRDIGMGSTAASTSMLQYETDVPLYKLAEMIGEKGATECYHAGVKAIQDLGRLVKNENIDCHFQYMKSLYVSATADDSVWLRKEFLTRKSCGLKVKWLDGNAVLEQYGIKCSGAILSDTAGSVDAYKLAHALIALSVKKGLKVFDQTSFDRMTFKNNKHTLHAADGQTITCEKIIFCNGFEATEILKEPVCRLQYTYACISEQHMDYKKNLDGVLVWDTATPYFYMRTTDDRRVQIGGEDTAYTNPKLQNAKMKIRQKRLLNTLLTRAPGIQFIEDFAWGGVFGSTKDSLPYIGKSPEYKNALFALGFGGNGIVFSVQAMHIINDLLEGRTNSLAHWYRFGR